MSDEQQRRPNGLVSSGIARGVTSGLQGEEVTARGIFEAIGGTRGILETLVPALLYLTVFVMTRDARLSVIAPAILAVVFVVIRLLQRQSAVTALSGAVGVAVSVLTTLVTGRGEDFFLPGFWINGIWATALTISLAVRWPLLGFVVGIFSNDVAGWRTNGRIRRTATITSLIWLSLFLLRLAVQVPLYVAGNVAALGMTRLVMGTPLFALVILITWLLFRNTPKGGGNGQQ